MKLLQVLLLGLVCSLAARAAHSDKVMARLLNVAQLPTNKAKAAEIIEELTPRTDSIEVDDERWAKELQEREISENQLRTLCIDR